MRAEEMERGRANLNEILIRNDTSFAILTVVLIIFVLLCLSMTVMYFRK